MSISGITYNEFWRNEIAINVKKNVAICREKRREAWKTNNEQSRVLSSIALGWVYYWRNELAKIETLMKTGSDY